MSTTSSAGLASPGGRVRAVFEVLRAPLLLSPLADVLAGACIARALLAATGAQWADVSVSAVALAGLVGVSLLGAGMAQNALADLDEDRRHKPDRPLARGALPVETVRLIWRLLIVVGVGLSALVSPVLVQVALVIVLVSAAYHAGGKRVRLLGCLLLGLARGLCMLLGVVAALGVEDFASLQSTWQASGALEFPAAARLGFVIPLYAVSIATASLHASTDDESQSSPWSLLGILGTLICLSFLVIASGVTLRIVLGTTITTTIPLVSPGAAGPPVAASMALLISMLAVARVVRAAQKAPPPVLTGVLLSGLYLFDASVCLLAVHALDVTWPLVSAGLALGLFGGSRLLLRSFPPS